MKNVLVLLVTLLMFGALSVAIQKHNASKSVTDYKDATYIIDGQQVTLKNGVSDVEAAPGSASRIVTKYFGNEVHADVNGDGKQDVIFLLTQESGGSGTFFYVVAALATDTGYADSQAYLIGDRIAPQTTEVAADGTILINYADRALGEPFSTRPSVGKTLRLRFDSAANQFSL